MKVSPLFPIKLLTVEYEQVCCKFADSACYRVLYAKKDYFSWDLLKFGRIGTYVGAIE